MTRRRASWVGVIGFWQRAQGSLAERAVLGSEPSGGSPTGPRPIGPESVTGRPAPPGQKPGFSHYCVKVAGFDRTAATAKLRKLGLKPETGLEKGTLQFRDLYNLPVEVIAG